MKYFYDTEFLESGPSVPLKLLSIGVVCEDGRELYLQSLDCPLYLANVWIVQNVFPHLEHIHKRANGAYYADSNQKVWQHRKAIANQLIAFVTGDKPELWGYYADYDHVILCQLFGTMMDLPKGWPMYTHDLKQWCDQLGNPKLPELGKGEHHALADARWNKQVYEFLLEIERA